MTPASSHTPGEWINQGETIFQDGTKAVSITSSGTFPHFVAHCEGENKEANARLIAAAPELLAALQRLFECTDVNLSTLPKETLDALDQAEAAISKATQQD